MKKKTNLRVYLDATAEQLVACNITESGFGNGELCAWDFGTISHLGPAAKVYKFYNEEDYFLVPLRYIRFIDLTIEEASFIYQDAIESKITIIPGLSIDQHVGNLEKKYFPSGPAMVLFYEVLPGYKLRSILSQSAHKYRLVGEFINRLQDMELRPVCDDEDIRLEYVFNNDIQKQVNELLNTYIGFWRSIAIKVYHDRENNIARYYVKYQLITGKDLTDDELIKAVEYIYNEHTANLRNKKEQNI